MRDLHLGETTIGFIDGVRPLLSDEPPADGDTGLPRFTKGETLVVSGWIAASAGAETIGQSVGLRIDDAYEIDAAASLRRSDVAERFASPNLEHAGFLAVVSTTNLDAGPHSVAVFTKPNGSSDPGVLEQQVSFALVDPDRAIPAPFASPTDRIIGHLDTCTITHASARAVAIMMTGWACDRATSLPVSEVLCLRGGEPLGEVAFGFRRPDVITYMKSAACEPSAFRVRLILPVKDIDARALSIDAVSTDRAGRRRFTLDAFTLDPSALAGELLDDDELVAEHERLVRQDLLELATERLGIDVTDARRTNGAATTAVERDRPRGNGRHPVLAARVARPKAGFVDGILSGADASWFDGERPSTGVQVRRLIELMQIIASRTLQTRYRGSVLGVFWSLSNPILMTGIYALIFGTAFASYYQGSVLRYVFATFVGLGVLSVFSGTTTQALTSIVANGDLLNKVRLPFSVFPISNVAANFFQFFVGTFPVFCIMTAVESHNPVNVIALLVPVFALLLVSIGFSLLTSALYVYFRDLPYLYEMAIFVVWITSPIFYPASLVPARVQHFLAFNPLIFIVLSIRQIALSKDWPDPHLMGAALLSGSICLVVGAVAFTLLRRDFMDLL
jgi:ABC-type polysaccharide/polyol phosphate export permease